MFILKKDISVRLYFFGFIVFQSYKAIAKAKAIRLGTFDPKNTTKKGYLCGIVVNCQLIQKTEFSESLESL